MDPITRRSMWKFVIHLRYRIVGDRNTWSDRHFKNLGIRDVSRLLLQWTTPCFCLLFWIFSNVCHFVCVWPTALKLGCITNFNMDFLVIMEFMLFFKMKFVLISSHYWMSSIQLFILIMLSRFKWYCMSFIMK